MLAALEQVAGDLVEGREVGADVVHAEEGGVFGGEVEEVSAIGQIRVGVRFVPECVVSEVYEMEVKEAALEFTCTVVKQEVSEEGIVRRGGGAEAKVEES